MWRSRGRVPEALSARRFELVDASGRVRAVLGNLSDSLSVWAPGIALLDEEGHERLSLMLGSTGPLLSFADAGVTALELGVLDRTPTVAADDSGPVDEESTVAPGPFVVLCDPSGTPRWSVRIGPDGHVAVIGIAQDDAGS
jgi:hypothetical protein